jgi:hypothetical protein
VGGSACGRKSRNEHGIVADHTRETVARARVMSNVVTLVVTH